MREIYFGRGSAAKAQGKDYYNKYQRNYVEQGINRYYNPENQDSLDKFDTTPLKEKLRSNRVLVTGTGVQLKVIETDQFSKMAGKLNQLKEEVDKLEDPTIKAQAEKLIKTNK